jgi:hypothetical protein
MINLGDFETLLTWKENGGRKQNQELDLREEWRLNLVGDYVWKFFLLNLNVEVLHVNSCNCIIIHFLGSFH